MADLAGEPKSADALRLGFAVGSQGSHAQRVRGNPAVPVLAAGASDHVPVLVPVAALSARHQEQPCQAQRRGPLTPRNGPRSETNGDVKTTCRQCSGARIISRADPFLARPGLGSPRSISSTI